MSNETKIRHHRSAARTLAAWQRYGERADRRTAVLVGSVDLYSSDQINATGSAERDSAGHLLVVVSAPLRIPGILNSSICLRIGLDYSRMPAGDIPRS